MSYAAGGCIDFPPVCVHLIETEQRYESKANESVGTLGSVFSSVN